MSTALVDEIAAEDDPVLRNLLITVAYGRLAEDFADRVDADNLSWAAFGTWASEGVGGAIRHHQTDQSAVLRLLRRVLGRRRYGEVADTAADAFARGNRSVFAHIGRAFAGFHEALDDRPPGSVDRFLAALPGAEEPDAGVTVDLTFDPPVGLADGFGLFRRVLDEADRRRRAQLVAAANLCLAYVEQVRLQEPVESAFGSVLTGRWRHRPLARRAAVRIVTEAVLRLRIDGRTFRPGRRLRRRDAPLYPRPLTELDPDLFGRFAPAFVHRGRFGRCRSRSPEADHWTSLADRLRYIAALMRSLQHDVDLLARSPFTDDEVAAIDAGTVPPRLRPVAV